jgi:hypothetical protein
MDKQLRKKFNNAFSEEKYQAYMEKVEALAPGALEFRCAETPIFVPAPFTQKMLHACEDIIDVITADHFKTLTDRSIPKDLNIPGEDDHPQMLVFDFGVCENETGDLEPQLIEMQGFPSLYGFELLYDELTKAYAGVPENYDSYLNGYNRDSYTQLLKEIIVGDHQPDEVVLLEIFPEKQKTRVDFYCTRQLLGISIVCITKLIVEGNQLFYMKDGIKIRIKRLYNRLIFDDLHQQEGLTGLPDLTQPYEVEWVPHPNWFYRISKFTLPFIDNPYVPQTFFLNEVTSPLPLDQYVLKPLFSFAGMGVVIDVSEEDITRIKDPENWILQKKVHYAPVIETMDEPAKAEIRLFYFWKKGWTRPVAVHNLSRLSKGKMIGTRYNKDKTWVGGSIAYFEKQSD